ncbi:MAG TPA: PspC domain-containing protein [Candidatus Limnocylindrales bacterium]|nr:PspC domain-containing protein [Candidatus Limnocylindrales bacterium]
MDDRLYKSRTDRMISGVAGGLAERLDVDPTLVRVIWAISMPLTGFLTLLLYIVMVVVVPEEPGPGWATYSSASRSGPDLSEADPSEPGPPSDARQAASGPGGESTSWTDDRRTERARRRAERARWRAEHGNPNGAIVLGAILILLGLLFLAQRVIPAFDWSVAWPLAVIVLGALLIVGSMRRA